MKGTIMAFIMTGLFIISVIVINLLHLFNMWMFFGLLFLGILYIIGYLYVVNYYYFTLQQQKDDNENKRKLDYCWNRANQILHNMPGGQGLEWRSGIGRRSEFRTFYDGIQNKPYRSMMGYLSETQQFVVLIYDIDGDDIVRFYADPSADIIVNHFYEFKPFQQGSMQQRVPGAYGSRYGSRYGRRPYGGRRPMSIHIDDGMGGGSDDFNSLPNNPMPTDDIASTAVETLRKDGKRK
jgi:hypothetical protein